MIEGEIRFRQGEEDFLGGPGAWAWGPGGVPHAFKVESESARMLVVVTPRGFEQMFKVGGVPLSESAEPPVHEYDPDAAVALSKQFGFEVIGPQLGMQQQLASAFGSLLPDLDDDDDDGLGGLPGFARLNPEA